MELQKLAPLGESRKKAELENLIIGYINESIEFDKRIGRSKNNFFSENYNEIGRNIKKFKDAGFRIFIGGGNIFFLKIEHKLTGWIANCVQIRGLAQRKIQVKEII